MQIDIDAGGLRGMYTVQYLEFTYGLQVRNGKNRSYVSRPEP